MKRLIRRIHYLLNRPRMTRELQAEMEFHREMCARDGAPAEAAPFGNVLRLHEESRDAWGWTWIDRTVMDVKYSLRTMKRSPGFTLAAIAMLAIGIGVNVAAFGFFNIVYFRPMPVRDPNTLVRIQRAAQGQFSTDLPYPMMDFYREHSRTLTAVLALDVANLLTERGDRPVQAFFVSENFFDELGGRAELGRLLSERAGGEREPVAVLGYDYWKTQLAGDPAAIGRTLRLNGTSVTVVGVAARDFSGLTYSSPDVWMPIRQQPLIIAGSELLKSYSADNDGVDVWGRLGPGVSMEVAAAELKGIARELRKLRPADTWEGEGLRLLPGGYAQNAGGRSRATSPTPTLQQKMLPIFGIVGALTVLILLVTCGNVGSLLLARGVSRQREIWIRTAVGAGTARVLRQLLTENVVLALIGGGMAVLLGSAVLKYLLIWTEAPAWLNADPDVRVYAFTVGLALVSAVAFGLTPALQVVKTFRRAILARQVLIGLQVAASCVLLIATGLLVRAIQEAIAGTPGFEYKSVIAIDPRLAFHGYSPAHAGTYLERLQTSLRSASGVESVSATLSPPLGGRTTTTGGEKDGKQFPIYVNIVDPEFFNTVRVPLVRGRNLLVRETGSAVVSEALARKLWPGEDPLGKIFQSGDTRNVVVGVADNAKVNSLEDDDPAAVYFAMQDGDKAQSVVLVRVSAGATESLAPVMARLARDVDAKVMPSVRTLDSTYKRKVEATRRSAAAVSVLGAVALGLACLGIVGVVAFAVSQRVKEISIRMALGALPSNVLGVIARQFWKPIAVGLLCGIGGAAALTQLMRGQLYGLDPRDPAAWAGGTLVLAVAAALAVFVPARKALKIDPARALRSQ